MENNPGLVLVVETRVRVERPLEIKEALKAKIRAVKADLSKAEKAAQECYDQLTQLQEQLERQIAIETGPLHDW